MSFDPSPLIDQFDHSTRCPVGDCPASFGGVLAFAYWTPRDGDTQWAFSDFLVGCRESGFLVLPECRLPALAESVDRFDVLDDRPKIAALTRAVNFHVNRHPWAEIVCPEGTLRLDLIPAHPEGVQAALTPMGGQPRVFAERGLRPAV